MAHRFIAGLRPPSVGRVQKVSVALLAMAGLAFVFTAPFQAANLKANTNKSGVPLGLPEKTWTDGSPEQIALGKKLFSDRRLSFNNTLSCSMCHLTENGFASNQTSRAIGIEGRTGRRNAPSILNVAYQKTFFHDGRETDLAQQAWLPLLDHAEMGNTSFGMVIDRIRSYSDYDNLFEKAFNGEGPTMHSVGTAIAAFERTLLSGNSRFDRWYFGKDETALTQAEKDGFEVFSGKGRCTQCHLIDSDSAIFTDHLFHDTGIGYYQTQSLGTGTFKVQLTPDTFISITDKLVSSASEPWKNDLGRFEVTVNPEDRWAFKTPSLRDVSRTGPYMHEGSLQHLEDVVDFYDRGGIPHDGMSDKIAPLGLTATEKANLVAFLKTLDGDTKLLPHTD